MCLSAFTDLEKACRRDRNFVKNKTHEITGSCLQPSDKKKSVFINYFTGTICEKDCKMIEIFEEGEVSITLYLRFEKTQTMLEINAQRALETCSRWNGIPQQKLQDLILENNPW